MVLRPTNRLLYFPTVVINQSVLTGSDIVKTIHFPKHTGLNPRPMTNVDRRALKYYRAVESKDYGRQLEIEREIRRDEPEFSFADLDTEYSGGKMLDSCTIK